MRGNYWTPQFDTPSHPAQRSTTTTTTTTGFTPFRLIAMWHSKPEGQFVGFISLSRAVGATTLPSHHAAPFTYAQRKAWPPCRVVPLLPPTLLAPTRSRSDNRGGLRRGILVVARRPIISPLPPGLSGVPGRGQTRPPRHAPSLSLEVGPIFWRQHTTLFLSNELTPSPANASALTSHQPPLL